MRAILILAILPTLAIAQTPRVSKAQQALTLAESGQCKEALPSLKREVPQIANRELKRATGLAGVRCSMALNQPEEAADFIRLLTREFPEDAEVLYQAVHVYSDLSLKSSQELLFKAPSS